jgi:parallel beta-helix repeat protein
MSVQKNKLAIFVVLAVVSALLLGGVSFTFFPSQTGPAPTPQVPLLQMSSNDSPSSAHINWAFNNSLSSNASNAFIPTNVGGQAYYLTSNNSSYHPLYVFSVSIVKPLDSIVIAPDGTVNSTAINCDGDIYTFTRDVVNQTLVIQKSNIVVDGVNHSLQDYTQWYTYALENIHLENLTGVTVKNLNVSDSQEGITIINCTNITIQNNMITDTDFGVYLTAVSNSTITSNSFNDMGVAVYNLGLYGYRDSYKLTVANNTVSNVGTGISLASSSTNTVTDNVIVNAYDPIYAEANSTIARNTMLNGIDAIGVASNDRVYDNTIVNFTESGILLGGVNSVIYQNTVTACANAVAMGGSSDAYPLGNNTLYHNNFINNTKPVTLYTNSSLAVNYWNNGREGNYWSGYNGTDANKDGLGDVSYQLGANNTDLYPLMQPYVNVVNSYDHAMGKLFFTLAGVIAAAGVFVVLTWVYFGKRNLKKAKAH